MGEVGEAHIRESVDLDDPSISELIDVLRSSVTSGEKRRRLSISTQIVIHHHLGDVPWIVSMVNQDNELSLALPSKEKVEIGEPEIDKALSRMVYRWSIYRKIPIEKFIDALEGVSKGRAGILILDCLNNAVDEVSKKMGVEKPSCVEGDALEAFKLLDQETFSESREIVPVGR